MAGTWWDLAKYRLEQADERLASARILLEHGRYPDSVSRSHYAMLLASRALLAARDLSPKTHAGTISAVAKEFVKPGLMSPQSARRLMEARSLREASDYADFVRVTEQDAEEQLEEAEVFVKEVKVLTRKLLRAEPSNR